MQLYGYFRSSAAYRVRIALALKGLRPQLVFVHLTRGGGEQKSPDYRKINPQALVPTLITDDGHVLGQSLAIIEYLDETHPKPPLLPVDPIGRARVRALALAVACEIHPLNNTRVLNHLTGTLGLSEAQKLAWYRHWIAVGLEGLEGLVAGHAATGRFCHGDAPTLADLCLVPQLANARRFDCDLAPYPTLVRIDAECAKLEAFQTAAPANQPDFEK